MDGNKYFYFLKFFLCGWEWGVFKFGWEINLGFVIEWWNFSGKWGKGLWSFGWLDKLWLRK